MVQNCCRKFCIQTKRDRFPVKCNYPRSCRIFQEEGETFQYTDLTKLDILLLYVNI